MRFLRHASVVVLISLLFIIATAFVLRVDPMVLTFCIAAGVVLMIAWTVATRAYFRRIQPYSQQLGMDSQRTAGAHSPGPDGSPRPSRTETEGHANADKRKATEAAQLFRNSDAIAVVEPPVPLDSGEVCHLARPATRTRETVGSLPKSDQGWLMVTGRRLLYVTEDERIAVPFAEISSLAMAGARSFGVRRKGRDGVDKFDVGYPREFLAYLGLVADKSGVSLPRVSWR